MSTVGKNGSLEIDWNSYDGEREETDKRTVKGVELKDCGKSNPVAPVSTYMECTLKWCRQGTGRRQ